MTVSQDMDEKLLYRVAEVAQFLSISRSKAYELVRTGQLRSVHIDGAQRVAGEDLRESVETLRRVAA